MRSPATRKRPTNLTLDANLVEEARAFDINVSEACERGLADEVKKAREAKWLAENKGALLNWNHWVQENGMPYDEYRQL
jgi:antitoxin CcdA